MSRSLIKHHAPHDKLLKFTRLGYKPPTKTSNDNLYASRESNPFGIGASTDNINKTLMQERWEEKRVGGLAKNNRF